MNVMFKKRKVLINNNPFIIYFNRPERNFKKLKVRVIYEPNK